MRFFAKSLGYGDEEDYWGIVGLLHDIDLNFIPSSTVKSAGASARGRHRRGYDIFCLLARIRHLLRRRTEARNGKGSFRRRRAYGTNLVGGAYASVEKRFGHGGLKSKKKFKDKKFAAGCSRDVIRTGAERLGWELDKLFEETIAAMRTCETPIADFMSSYGK